jgi:hypothetical protein
MKWLGNPCGRFRKKICLLLSGALEAQEADEVKSHLDVCEDCREYCRQVKSVTTPLAQWGQSFSHLEPGQTAQRSWAMAVQEAEEPMTKLRRVGLLLLHCWRELFRPFRHAWAGMAALWLLMWGIHLHLSIKQPSVSYSHSSPTPAVVQALEEQRQILAELIPPTADNPSTVKSPPADRPRRDNSRPRSESTTSRQLA